MRIVRISRDDVTPMVDRCAKARARQRGLSCLLRGFLNIFAQFHSKKLQYFGLEFVLALVRLPFQDTALSKSPENCSQCVKQRKQYFEFVTN